MTDTIRLCGELLPVVPQKIGRLKHRLKPGDIQKILSPQFDEESYRLLSVLIPALEEKVPLWKWEGYGSKEAADNGEYVDSHDQSPDTDQIAAAFEKAVLVGGLRRLGKIAGLVGAMANAQSSTIPASTTPALPASPGSNGDGPVTASTTSDPT